MRVVFVLICLAGLAMSSCSGLKSDEYRATYTNPVLDRNAPDPTVIRAKDGTFYAYATWRDKNVPVYKSTDMVNWEYLGGAFEQDKVPMYVENGAIWAPDINYIEGKYVLYFSESRWAAHWESCICRAVSDKPEGPYTNPKRLFGSRDVGVENSIDPVIFQEKGRKYLAWGSFFGIYITELSEDGLEVLDLKDITRIAGNAYEGTYIHKRDGYYYLFASVGRCCDGLKSTYKTVVGRSESLFGPYVDKQGRKMLDNHHEVLLEGDSRVKGPGHDSQIIADDKGQDWIFYHGYDVNAPNAGRKMFMDRVVWIDGWPQITLDKKPSVTSEAPYIKKR